jgi:hypothetical protein
MATVIVSEYSNGGVNGVSSASFGGVSREMQMYVNNQMAMYQSQAPSALALPTLFNDYINSASVRNIESLRYKLSSPTLEPIAPLTTVEEIQNAPTHMIPFILAEPNVSKLLQRGYIYGYGEEVECNNGVYVYGEDSRTYRDVVSCMAQRSGSDIIFKQYIEATDSSRRTLSLEDKSVILGIWDVLRTHHKSDDVRDITSEWNSDRIK